jgi:hypothetical protein
MHDTQDYLILVGVIFFLMYLAYGVGTNVERKK